MFPPIAKSSPSRPVLRILLPTLAAFAYWAAGGSARADLVLQGGDLRLVEEGGVIAPGNLSASGTAFAKDLLPGYPSTHTIPRLNDQLFGNSNSWIGDSAGTFAGVNFGATPVPVSSIAFGRDNHGGFTDRTLGVYTLQYTTVPNPDENTPAGSWITIGTLDYQFAGGTNFSFPSRRHRFTFDAVTATGIRLLVPSGGLASGTCIDELEAYSGIVVNTTVDENDDIASSGTGISLREAVREAASGDIIVFDPALSGQTITLTTANGGEIAIGNDLTIDASSLPAGITIDGGAGSNRIFHLDTGRLILKNLNLTGGNGIGASTTLAGGAILTLTDTILDLKRCALYGNSATLLGGAIHSTGVLNLEHCTLTGNYAGQSSTGNGGAINNFGGTLSLVHCTITGNTAESLGGGIRSDSAPILKGSIIAGNTAVSGPDIYCSVAFTPTVVNFIGNLSGSGMSAGPNVITGPISLSALGLHGGGTGTVRLLPGALARNAANILSPAVIADQRGFPIVGVPDLGAFETQIGAIPDQTIYEDTSSGAIAFTVGSVGTLSAASGNTAVIAHAGIVLGGSGANRTVTVIPVSNAVGTATITLTDSLSGETQQFSVTVNPVNDAPTFTKGANQVLIQNAPAQTIAGWATGFNPGPVDEAGQSVLAYLVTNNNNALFAVQPAIDASGALTFTPAMDASGIASVNVSVQDNGGTANGGVDTSAAQTFTITITPVVTTTANSGPGSLRAALASAAAISGANTIPFASNLSGQTITIGSEISVSDNGGVTLDASSLAAGITISGGGTSRIFFVQAFIPLAITGVTFTGGNGAGESSGNGGAIFNRGILTLTRCTFIGNSVTTSGGAIYSGSQANAPVITLTHCTFSGNTAGSGGAFSNGTASRATLKHCTFFGNNAAQGGGIYTDHISQMTLTNSIVGGNTAVNSPDILRGGGTITPSGVNIIENLAGSSIVAGTSVLETAPLVGPLGNYGGQTQTMPLLPGSPARNAATVLSPAITADQRGFPIVGAPDSGAYEAGTLTNFNAFIWESLPTAGNGLLTDPLHASTFDYDGDGQTNMAEWLAFTNPVDNNSYLRVTQMVRSGNTLHVTFPTVVGRSYFVEGTTTIENPLSWIRLPGPATPGTGAPITVVIPLGTNEPAYFVRVGTGP